jgi:biotin carboxylase
MSVFTSGNRPDHPGHAFADRYFPGDFSDAEQMIEVARQSCCDFVISASNDYAYLSACKVAKTLSLPGFDPLETGEILHHKHLFKALANTLDLPITRFVTLPAGSDLLPADAALKYPLVVKPVDLTGGKGISVVRMPAELPTAIAGARRISKQGVLVIEEYFEGSLHSYSTIIENGKVVFDYADNEYCQPTPYLVSTSTSIASVPLHVLNDLRHKTEKLASQLDLVDGVLHCQFLYGGGNYMILEYTRRCSGDLYSDVVEAVTGVRHAEQFVRQSAGLSLDLSSTRPIGDYIVRHCVFPDRPGRFDSIEVNERIAPWVLSITETLPRGHVFETGRLEKAAVIVLHFPNLHEMLRFRPKLINMLRCRVAEASEFPKAERPKESWQLEKAL